MGTFSRSLAVGAFLAMLAAPSAHAQLVGSGIHDITGPVAETMMAGYVDPKQRSSGIHMRLRARAYVIADEESGQRVVFVVADLAHLFQAVKLRVVELLRKEFGSVYDERNVLLSATHTHSGPGGYSHHVLYNLSSLGFSPQNFAVITDGIYQAIRKAHKNLAPGSLRIATGELHGLGRNRSLEAYRRNPSSERSKWGEDTDPRMTVLRLTRNDGTDVGSIAWYALHPTSLPSANTLISSDNRGWASFLFEDALGANPVADETFVAAFPNTNAGDVSPNRAGDLHGHGTWTCELKEPFACAKRAGVEQYRTARALFDEAAETIVPGIDYRHSFVNFSDVTVDGAYTGTGVRYTCSAAIGLSMLAGTEDGRGIGSEGERCSSVGPAKKLLCLRDRCHGEKPVAIQPGKKRPDPWTPDILPLQILRLGQLAIVAVPAEMTTMSGRRLVARMERALAGAGVTHVVLTGYANAYAGYVATREEYQAQQYEGASTHFGEWTLAAYEQELTRLAVALRDGEVVASGPSPRDPSPANPLIPAEAIFDAASGGFGSVERDAKGAYRAGELVRVQFRGAYPNNDLHLQSSYLEVQRHEDGEWRAVAFDWTPTTRFEWQRVGVAGSRITVSWETAGAASGRYRILHRGVARRSGGDHRYEGLSREFDLR